MNVEVTSSTRLTENSIHKEEKYITSFIYGLCEKRTCLSTAKFESTYTVQNTLKLVLSIFSALTPNSNTLNISKVSS